MRKALALMLALAGCGDGVRDNQGGKPEPTPPESNETVMTCFLDEVLSGLPDRSLSFNYVVATSEDGSKKAKFSISYNVENASELKRETTKQFEKEDAHTTVSIGQYIAFADGNHAHLYNTQSQKESDFNCEVSK